MNSDQADNHSTESRPGSQSHPADNSGQPPQASSSSNQQSTPVRPRFEYSKQNQATMRHNQRNHALKGFFSVVQLFVGAAVLAFIINQLVFQPYEVFGQSMIPTLQEGDRLIVSKLGKTWATVTRHQYLPKRGEIIVFHNPNNPQIQLVKRVVGLPGDQVMVQDGEITIYSNDSPRGFNFDERFGLNLGSTVGNVNLTVPPDEIFVVGDNRLPNGSLDSRNDLGTVPLDQVVGDLVFRIFPVDDAAIF